MDKTHDLLFELVGGPNPPADSRFIPHVALQKSIFQGMLLESSNPSQDIATVLARFKVTATAAITEFQKSLGDADLDELTSLANASRNVLSWLREIEEALQVSDKIKMIAQALNPMAWLEALIKTLEFKSMIRQTA